MNNKTDATFHGSGPESLLYVLDYPCNICDAGVNEWCYSNGVWVHLNRMLFAQMMRAEGKQVSPELDHAWATIPNDKRVGDGEPYTPLSVAAVRRVWSLAHWRNIVTAVCYSGLIVVGIVLILAMFNQIG